MMSISCRLMKSIRAIGALLFVPHPEADILNRNPAADACRRPQAGEAARGPGPREIVATNRAERVEQLAAEEKARVAAAFQRPRVDLLQRDSAAGDFRFLVAFVAGPGERVAAEPID